MTPLDTRVRTSTGTFSTKLVIEPGCGKFSSTHSVISFSFAPVLERWLLNVPPLSLESLGALVMVHARPFGLLQLDTEFTWILGHEKDRWV
jgi:hypothetical protein